MSASNSAKLYDKKIKDMVAKLKKTPKLKLGVINSSPRWDGLSNAKIGAIHELGLGNNQVRSFIMLPMYEDFFNDLTSRYWPDELLDILFREKDGPRKFMETCGRSGLRTILDAFDREGTSSTPWPPSDMTYKKVHMTLTETGQLRDSISWEIVDDNN